MEQKDQRAYRTTFHMDQTTTTKTKGAVSPEGTAEGQTFLTHGVAVGTIRRQDRSLPLRPKQNMNEALQPQAGGFLGTFYPDKKCLAPGRETPPENKGISKGALPTWAPVTRPQGH